MQTENCQNPLMRAHLGSFNKCEEAEDILGRYPIITALHDVATDLNICGHGRCHIFYMDITNNLHKIVIGMILVCPARHVDLQTNVQREKADERNGLLHTTHEEIELSIYASASPENGRRYIK